MNDFMTDTTVVVCPPRGTTLPTAFATRVRTGYAAAMPLFARDNSAGHVANYISSTTDAAGTLRADLGAKQAAPPRGTPR